MNNDIYVFDMGRVITKPARMDLIYQAGEMRCSYPEFKFHFYDSQEADQVYRGIINDDVFFEYIKNICGSDRSTEELKELYTKNKGGIYLETMDVIRELKESGNGVYLLSNLKQIDYDFLKENIDLGLFDELFLSYQLGMSKPHEDIFEYVIDTLGTNEFYFFDDSSKNIVVAKSLGIDAHQTTGEDIRKCLRLIRKKNMVYK